MIRNIYNLPNSIIVAGVAIMERTTDEYKEKSKAEKVRRASLTQDERAKEDWAKFIVNSR